MHVLNHRFGHMVQDWKHDCSKDFFGMQQYPHLGEHTPNSILQKLFNKVFASHFTSEKENIYCTLIINVLLNLTLWQEHYYSVLGRPTQHWGKSMQNNDCIQNALSVRHP